MAMVEVLISEGLHEWWEIELISKEFGSKGEAGMP